MHSWLKRKKSDIVLYDSSIVCTFYVMGEQIKWTVFYCVIIESQHNIVHVINEDKMPGFSIHVIMPPYEWMKASSIVC